MKNIKVLHIVTSMDPIRGGVAQAVRTLVKNNSYFENEVLCFDDETEQFMDTFKLTKLGKGITSYQYHRGLETWLLSNFMNFSHIIVHGIWQYHNYAIFRFVQKLRRLGEYHVPKVLIMPHGMLDPYFQKAKERWVKALRNELVWNLTELNSINHADAMLFTCRQEMLLARKTFRGYQPKREIVTGLGISKPPLETEEMTLELYNRFPILKNQAFYLYMSRIHPKKGIDLLLQKYVELRTKLKKLPNLVIAGPIDSTFALNLQLRYERESGIFFTGMLSGNIKWATLYKAELFILPSHQENFGIAVVEALACGKPVIISDQVNIWSEIVEGGAGLIIEDSLKGIEKGIETYNNLSGSERKEMGLNSVSVYQTKFSTIETLRRLHAIFKEEPFD